MFSNLTNGTGVMLRSTRMINANRLRRLSILNETRLPWLNTYFSLTQGMYRQQHGASDDGGTLTACRR
jgi:hypothetical protein